MSKYLDLSGYFACMRKHWLLFLLTLLVVVVFLSAPFFMVYRTLRAKVPGASNVLPAK